MFKRGLVVLGFLSCVTFVHGEETIPVETPPIAVVAPPKATYSDDLSDMGAHKPFESLGDLGEVETIIDLRGFIPFSAPSKSKSLHPANESNYWLIDNNAWFKLPLVRALEIIYYGADPAFKGRFDNVTKITEDALADENKTWGEMAYTMCNEKGEILYKQAGADSGFVNAEPIAILLTKSSSFVIINFKYNNNRRHDTGQLLMCYEFSRSLKMSKNQYDLYDTFALNKAAKKKLSPANIAILTQIARNSFGIP